MEEEEEEEEEEREETKNEEEEKEKGEEKEEVEGEEEEQNSTLSLKYYYNKRKYMEPICSHPSLLTGGLQLQKPIICNPIPAPLPLQPHHVHPPPPPSHPTTPGIFVYPLHTVNVPSVQWQPHIPPTTPHQPHSLLSPPGFATKAPVVPWQCRPMHAPPALSPRQDDKFMFVRLADSTHWQCKLCNRVFTSQGSLRAHARIHNNEKPYRCKYCQRSFTQASTLRSHERLHTGEKPYKCGTCGKCFTQSAGLRSHKKTHTAR